MEELAAIGHQAGFDLTELPEDGGESVPVEGLVEGQWERQNLLGLGQALFVEPQTFFELLVDLKAPVEEGPDLVAPCHLSAGAFIDPDGGLTYRLKRSPTPGPGEQVEKQPRTTVAIDEVGPPPAKPGRTTLGLAGPGDGELKSEDGIKIRGREHADVGGGGRGHDNLLVSYTPSSPREWQARKALLGVNEPHLSA